MSKSKIEVGDVVTVYFATTKTESDMEVLHVPCATGDSWRFRKPNGELIYTTHFEKMTWTPEDVEEVIF